MFAQTHKKFKISHYKVMAVLISFIAVEIIIFLLVLPVKITVKINILSTREKGIFTVKIFDVIPMKIKIEKLKEQVRISVNGKYIKNRQAEQTIVNDAEYSERINLPWIDFIKGSLSLIESVEILGIVGGKDAFQTACHHAIIMTFLNMVDRKVSRCFILPDFHSDKYIFDGKITMRISIFDILEMVIRYGNKRNFATNN